MAVNAAAVWRVRPGGNNANGGGYDATISGAGPDYSQQNAAQAIGTNGAGSATTTFTDATANAFTAQMVGNAINIAGQGTYFVVTFTDSAHVIVDRALGTFSSASWKLGGAWADFWTNTTSTGPLVPGNTVYILGTGNPAPPYGGGFDYSPPAEFTPVSGSKTGGWVRFVGDPATPSNGKPLISTPGRLFSQGDMQNFVNLYMVGNGSTNATHGAIDLANSEPCYVTNCVFDQNGYDLSFINGSSSGVSTGGAYLLVGCEVFSSVGARGTSLQPGISAGHYGLTTLFCNIHDCIGPGIAIPDAYNHCLATIVANNGGVGVSFPASTNQNNTHHTHLAWCTIDGNLGGGIELTGATSVGLCQASILSNIISNHPAGKFGLFADSATSDLARGFCDYNVFYGNSADLSNITYGPHDTHGGSNPFVGQPTENFNLA